MLHSSQNGAIALVRADECCLRLRRRRALTPSTSTAISALRRQSSCYRISTSAVSGRLEPVPGESPLVHGGLETAIAKGLAGSFTYERRRPEAGTLYQMVRDNLQTLYAAVEDGFATPLPAFVRDEFERYLDCGILCRGLAWLECEACQARRLVAFSCKSRAFCPSCLG